MGAEAESGAMHESARWNARYAAQPPPQVVTPNPFLHQHLAHLAKIPRGRVLELAMGEGHNAIFLAQQGLSVTGVDISAIAVERAQQLAKHLGVSLDLQVADLRTTKLPENTYDAIVCFYYLDRQLFPQMVATLRPGGVLMYETYTSEQAQYGRPTNPAYLLQPNELLEAFKDFRIRVYRDLVLDGLKAVASLIGEKSGNGWGLGQ
jgi:tellurite methyltransferase